MPRPSNWKSPTTAIRVPAHAVDQLMAIARQLDTQSFVQNPAAPPPLIFTIESAKGTERYFVQAEPCTDEELEQIDQALDRLYEQLQGHKTEELLYVAAKIAQAVGKRLP